MMEDHDVSHRMLRAFGTGPKTDGGPLAVLIVVCVLFFIIWIPMLCRRRCRDLDCYNRAEQREADRHDEIIRVSLENLHRLGLNEAWSNNSGPPAILSNPIRGMSPEDRMEYINNVLVSRKILKVFKEGPPTDDGDLDDSSTGKPSGRKTSLLLADLVDVESTTKVVSVEPCIICLNEYVEGDVLCWSQNSKCQHFMHKECASEWLMSHEECPLCRHNYLSLDGDDHMDENIGDDDHAEGNISVSNRRITDEVAGGNGGEEALSLLRGIHLLYALSRLQNLADARPNTTFRLEGIELADGQRGVVEVQRSGAGGGRASTSDGGMSIRMRPLESNGLVGRRDRHAVDAASSTFAVQPVMNSDSSSSTGSVTDGNLHEDTFEHSPTPWPQAETTERVTAHHVWSEAAVQEGSQNKSNDEDCVD